MDIRFLQNLFFCALVYILRFQLGPGLSVDSRCDERRGRVTLREKEREGEELVIPLCHKGRREVGTNYGRNRRWSCSRYLGLDNVGNLGGVIKEVLNGDARKGSTCV